jgi:hypothetical protein
VAIHLLVQSNTSTLIELLKELPWFGIFLSFGLHSGSKSFELVLLEHRIGNTENLVLIFKRS